jgi:hypothetical protein
VEDVAHCKKIGWKMYASLHILLLSTDNTMELYEKSRSRGF